jgi:hypothetical protein
VLWGRVTGMVGVREVEEDVMRVAIMGVWLRRMVGCVGSLTERGEVPDGSKKGGEEGFKRRKADGCYSYCHLDAARRDQRWLGWFWRCGTRSGVEKGDCEGKNDGRTI